MADKKPAVQKTVLWKVGCEGLPDIYVSATNWELATVEAAHLWGVRWGAVAARCVELERRPYLRNVCPKCGQYFNGPDVLCEKCRLVTETEIEREKRASAQYWRAHAIKRDA